MVYCLREQIERGFPTQLLDHYGSEQFGHVELGDVLWIVGPDERNSLVTLGPLRVAEKVGQKEVNKRNLGYLPWPAKFHVLCTPGDACIARKVPLTSVIAKI